MTTLTELAQNPESTALFAHLSPEAQRTASTAIAFLDTFPEDRQDLALLGLQCLAYAGTNQTPPDDIKAALLGATYERACQQRGASSLDSEPPAFVNDDPVITLVDTGERSGIRVERYDWDETPKIWLEFSAGRSPSEEGRPIVMVDVDLYGGRQGIGLTVDGREINGYIDDVWTLDDLRRLHAALGLLLADERLIGALAEQTV